MCVGGALEDHVAFIRVLSKGVSIGGVSIEGRFVYTRQHKPLKPGRSKTESYIDDRRRLDARFRVKCFQEAVGEMLMRQQGN